MGHLISILFMVMLISQDARGQAPQLVLPEGHTNYLYYAQFSPDGNYIVSASADYTAKIWNAADGKLLKILKGHISLVKCANFSPNGKFIVTGSFDGTAKIWNAFEGTLVADLKGHTGWVLSANFSPDGKTIVTSSVDKTIKTWDAVTGSLLREWRGHDNGINSVVYSPDGKFILSASRDSIEKIWNAMDGKLIKEMKGHTYYVNTANYSPDGKYIVTASDDGTTLIRNNNGEILHELTGHFNRVNSAVFSPDGKYIATASSDSTVKIWDAATGIILKTLTGHTSRVFYASFSPNGKYIVSASADHTFRIWDWNEGNTIRMLTVHIASALSATFSPDGKYIVSSCSDSTAKIWNAADGKLIRVLTGHTNNVCFVSTSPDSKYIVTGSWDNTARIWSADDGHLITELNGHTAAVNSVMYSPDQKWIVTTSNDRIVKIWNASDGKLFRDIEGINDIGTYAEFSPDNRYVVTASQYYHSTAWDFRTGKPIAEFESKEKNSMDWKAAYDPTGKFIVTAGGVEEVGDKDMARIWNASDGKLITEMKGHEGWIYSAEFSPDGKSVLTTSADGTGKIWNAGNGKLIVELKGHSHTVHSGSYSPNGKKIITTSLDNSIKIWDAKTGRLIYTFFTIDSSGYILLLPDGYYSSTTEAAKQLNYVRGLQAISFEQLDIKYNRPDKVLQAIGNKDTLLIKSYRKAWEKRMKKLAIDTTAFREGYSIPESGFVNRSMIEYEQKSGQLLLHIRGYDSTYQLDRFNIWINESPVFGQRGISIRRQKRNDLDTTISIELSQGTNRIETSVTNVNGTESYREPLIVNYTPLVKQKELIRFIGIGLDQFAESKYNLKYSVKDIRDLALKLKEKYGEDIQVDTLFNGSVTVSSVKELRNKLMTSNVNDKVIIAYSGHGLLNKDFDYYLSTYSINFDKPGENGLPYDELESLLDSIPARRKLMLIDACHSGEVDKEELVRINATSDSLHLRKGVIPVAYESDQTHLGMKNSFELMQTLFVNVGKSTGATIISAAAGTQFALERGDLQNGVFTYCILEAMEKNKTMKISELKKIVGERVEQLTHGLQKPTSRNETIAVDWSLW